MERDETIRGSTMWSARVLGAASARVASTMGLGPVPAAALGSSGCRLPVTLLGRLERTGGRRGRALSASVSARAAR